MIMELDSRLLKSENRFYAQYLLPGVVEQITNDQIVTIHQTYQMNIGLSLDDFRREVERWRTRCRIMPCDKVPTTLNIRNFQKSALRFLAATKTSMALSKLTSKSRWMCIKPKADSLSFLIVERMYVFKRFNTLNDLSAVALATGIVKRTHIIVLIDGYSAGFTISCV
jgi:hypothetical protein